MPSLCFRHQHNGGNGVWVKFQTLSGDWDDTDVNILDSILDGFVTVAGDITFLSFHLLITVGNIHKTSPHRAVKELVVLMSREKLLESSD